MGAVLCWILPFKAFLFLGGGFVSPGTRGQTPPAVAGAGTSARRAVSPTAPARKTAVADTSAGPLPWPSTPVSATSGLTRSFTPGVRVFWTDDFHRVVFDCVDPGVCVYAYADAGCYLLLPVLQTGKHLCIALKVTREREKHGADISVFTAISRL